MHISLTPELEKLVKEKVNSGLYNNSSEVIRDALRQMNRYEEFFYDLKRKHLIELLEEGKKAGEVICLFLISFIREKMKNQISSTKSQKTGSGLTGTVRKS